MSLVSGLDGEVVAQHVMEVKERERELSKSIKRTVVNHVLVDYENLATAITILTVAQEHKFWEVCLVK